MMSRKIRGIGGESRQPSLQLVDLRVEHDPTSTVPVLDNPVIDPLPCLEVAAEPATRPTGHTGAAQQGDGQRGEVSAVAGKAQRRLACLDEGPRVELKDALDDPRRGADLHIVGAIRR